MTSPQEPADSVAQRDLALRALDELVRAAHQWSLYGPEHPVAKQACDTAAGAFADMISGRPHFTLTVVESGLLAEGEELPDRPPLRHLHQALRLRQVAALTILPEVTWDEVLALIRILGTDHAELTAAGGARRGLQEAGCQHIEMTEVDYSRFVPASQAQWLSAFAGAQVGIHVTVESLVGACVELAGDQLHVTEQKLSTERGLPMPFPVPIAAGQEAADEVLVQADLSALQGVAPEDYVAVGLAWLIQASADAMAQRPPAERKRWRDTVAQCLAELDLSLQARILRAPRQAGSDGPDALAAIVADRSPEEIADLIVARPAAVVGEPSASLERILRRVLPDERKLLAAEPLLRQRLMERGMSQDSFRNVVGLLLDQLAADMAMRVGGAGQWLGEFQAAALPVGGGVDDWPDLLGTVSADAVAQSRLRVLLAIMPGEHDAAHFLDLAGHLDACATERAAAGDSAAVLEVLRALAREVDDGDALWAPIATSVLQRMATEPIAQVLRQALAEVGAQERWPLLAIAGKMGNECADVLVEEVEKAEDPQVRAMAVRLLADAGERGASQVRHTLAQGSLDRVMDVVAALIEGRDERFLHHLAAGLDHRQAAVRLGLAECLGRAPGLVSEQLLIRALYDDDPAVQMQAAQSLGDIRARGAVHALALIAGKGPLHGRRLEVRKAAVQALGRIGSPEAVPALKEILQKRGLLFRERAQELHALAATALTHIEGPEAQQALAAYSPLGPAAGGRELAVAGERGAARQRHPSTGRPTRG